MFTKLSAAVGEKQARQRDRFSTADLYINRLGVSLVALLVFYIVAVALQRQDTRSYQCHHSAIVSCAQSVKLSFQTCKIKSRLEKPGIMRRIKAGYEPLH